MQKSNVTKTRVLNLCTSCGICSTICPNNAIKMEYIKGQFLPKIDKNKCTNCKLCLKLCPGIDINHSNFKNNNSLIKKLCGSYLGVYTAYSKNARIRTNSTSGGIITTLIIELIKKKDFDTTFVLNFDKFNGKPAELKPTNDIGRIVKAAKSKYIPASVYEVIKTLRENNKKSKKRCIIIGTSCQILGIKKFLREYKIPEKNLLFLGLFCEKTLNFNLLKYFEENYKKSDEKLIRFDFKNKEGGGWPGNSKLYFDSGRNLRVDQNIRMQLKKYFQLNRCLFCLDKLNKLADISFGDCYIKGEESYDGKSNVIIRTKKGKKIFDRYSYLFELKKVGMGEIAKSQLLINKKENFKFIELLTKNKKDLETKRKLAKLQKYISWGQDYKINRIKTDLFLSEIKNRLKNIFGKIKEAVIFGIILISGVSVYYNKSLTKKKNGENILIVGGELFNKGAQAMTFTVVDQIKRKFPSKNIFLFSILDFERKKEEKELYTFHIMPWDLRVKLRTLGFLRGLFKKNTFPIEKDIKKIVNDTYCIIDISGYGLSSQLGVSSSYNYLMNLIIAKKYSIPYYILPQSIGPFNYSIIHKIFLYPLMKLYLKYPQKIFLREMEGLEQIKKFTKKNIKKSYDIVLQNNNYDLSNIFNKKISFNNIKIKPNSVGIIPNLRIINHTNPQKIYLIYNLLIKNLIKSKKTIYLIRHSYEDLEICERIKNCFLNNKNVIIISGDLNAIELEHIIKQFDFIIASRYHSIIHAYKNGVPSIVIGWATKYFELLKDFGQLDYFFDCRKSLDYNKLGNSLKKMIKNYKHEKSKIEGIMDKINEKIFDDIFAIKTQKSQNSGK